MPSYLHELLLVLFRNRCASAAELLRELNVRLPDYDDVCTEASDLNDLRPAEYRADLVLFLVRQSQKVLGVIVEVQLGRDEDKRYAWPAYIANLRSRHRCPVCLLVDTIEDAGARWAARPIELGPGTRCKTCVVGPSNMPVVNRTQRGTDNVELAALSAIEHARGSDKELAVRSASTAMTASANLDSERSRLYLDLLLICLSPNSPEGLDAMKNSLGFEYQSAFTRRYVAEGLEAGRSEGRTEGRMEGRTERRMDLILNLLTVRFGSLSPAALTRVRGMQDAQLDTLAERLLSAQTLDEALG